MPSPGDFVGTTRCVLMSVLALSDQQKDCLRNAIVQFGFPPDHYDFSRGVPERLANTRAVEIAIGRELKSGEPALVKDGLSNVLYWGYAQMGFWGHARPAFPHESSDFSARTGLRSLSAVPFAFGRRNQEPGPPGVFWPLVREQGPHVFGPRQISDTRLANNEDPRAVSHHLACGSCPRQEHTDPNHHAQFRCVRDLVP